MRKPKFRAWDKEGRRMWYGVENWEEFGYILHPQGEYVNWELAGQYTGLTDKHGREIYEGDIVRLFGRKFIVIYSEDMAGYGLASSVDERPVLNLNRHRAEKVEVIGNIYETPGKTGNI